VPYGKKDPPDALSLAFGDRLHRLRGERGWSRDRLAAVSGVSHRTIDYLEHGRRSPSLRVVVLLAAAFEVPAGSLVDGLTAGEAAAGPGEHA